MSHCCHDHGIICHDSIMIIWCVCLDWKWTDARQKRGLDMVACPSNRDLTVQECRQGSHESMVNTKIARILWLQRGGKHVS